MIWAWDLWAVMIAHGARTAVFTNVEAHLTTLTAEVEDMMAVMGQRLGYPLADVVRAVNAAAKGVQ